MDQVYNTKSWECQKQFKMLYDKILGPDNSPTTSLYILYLQHSV